MSKTLLPLVRVKHGVNSCFFFQAEDGIRDRNVTGVQTCALPIFGLSGAIVYGIVHRLGLPPWPAAALSVAATMLATGCLHEDGLADTADGVGGGHTREQKLDIMRDSRIGTYGVCALAMSLLLRVGA